MRLPNRRRLLLGIGTGVALNGVWSLAARAAMGPNDKFDLVIKGGEVLDPSQGLRAKRDIGIRYGIVEALEADIPSARARCYGPRCRRAASGVRRHAQQQACRQGIHPPRAYGDGRGRVRSAVSGAVFRSIVS